MKKTIKIEKEVTICDRCKANEIPKSDFRIDHACFVCGIDLCSDCSVYDSVMHYNGKFCQIHIQVCKDCIENTFKETYENLKKAEEIVRECSEVIRQAHDNFKR